VDAATSVASRQGEQRVRRHHFPTRKNLVDAEIHYFGTLDAKI
jgi:hypothetical protein